MKLKALFAFIFIFCIAACDESPEGNQEGENNSDGSVVVELKCDDIENCQESLYGYPLIWWSDFLETHFSFESKNSQNNVLDSELMTFQCGASVIDLFTKYYGTIPNDQISAIYNFSSYLIDTQSCVYHEDYKQKLIDLINK